MCARARACMCVCVCVCCVGRLAVMGMNVCVRVCGGASAMLAALHDRELYIIIVKLLTIIFNQTCSCCQLFVLNDWNVT